MIKPILNNYSIYTVNLQLFTFYKTFFKNVTKYVALCISLCYYESVRKVGNENMKYYCELKYSESYLQDLMKISKALNNEFNIEYDLDKIRIFI